MQMNRGGLRPAETTHVIQAAIMGLTPQQVLLRDEILELVRNGPLGDGTDPGSREVVENIVSDIGPALAAQWREVMRSASDRDDALTQLLAGYVDGRLRKLNMKLFQWSTAASR